MAERTFHPHHGSRSWRIAALMLALAALMSFATFGQTRAQDSSDLAGQYTVSLSRDDISTEVAGGFSYVGRWRVGLNADGTYEAERLDVGVVVHGTYSVSGNQITFNDESGLLSCSNPAAAPIEGGDLVSGTYEWTQVGTEVTFTPVQDSCPGRVILMSTFAFKSYVACTTVPLPAAELSGSPEASPVAVTTPEVAPSPTKESPLSVLTPNAPAEEPTSASTPSAAESAQLEPVIDELLSQLTACWATGDPDLWLPLLSNEFRSALINSDPEFRTTLAASMTAPIVWERAGEIDVTSATQVSAIVRSTVGTEEDFQRFEFVFEDGEWRWNG